MLYIYKKKISSFHEETLRAVEGVCYFVSWRAADSFAHRLPRRGAVWSAGCKAGCFLHPAGRIPWERANIYLYSVRSIRDTIDALRAVCFYAGGRRFARSLSFDGAAWNYANSIFSPTDRLTGPRSAGEWSSVCRTCGYSGTRRGARDGDAAIVYGAITERCKAEFWLARHNRTSHKSIMRERERGEEKRKRMSRQMRRVKYHVICYGVNCRPRFNWRAIKAPWETDHTQRRCNGDCTVVVQEVITLAV